MSDLQQARARLTDDLNRLLVTAETAEQDAEHMRAAIIDALEIHGTAKMLAEGEPEGDGHEMLAAAANAMAQRLQELSRVHVSTEEIELPTNLGLDL